MQSYSILSFVFQSTRSGTGSCQNAVRLYLLVRNNSTQVSISLETIPERLQTYRAELSYTFFSRSCQLWNLPFNNLSSYFRKVSLWNCRIWVCMHHLSTMTHSFLISSVTIQFYSSDAPPEHWCNLTASFCLRLLSGTVQFIFRFSRCFQKYAH